VSPIDGCRVELRRAYRFGRAPGVGELAEAVRSGDVEGVLERLASQSEGLEWRRISEEGGERPSEALARALESGFAGYLDAVSGGAEPEEILARFGEFRVLAPFRRGPAGTEALNAAAAECLRRRLGLPPEAALPGAPVMVVRNDYATGLFNGDVGILAPGADGLMRAHFPGGFDEAAGRRAISAARLPAHEPAFALTVHKAQGSEFERVLVVLPPRAPRGESAEALGRELLYTALTRARSGVTVWSTEQTLRRAVATRVPRASGLRARLTGGASGALAAGRSGP
jgi:exodeoxyribonuclease V alpha subunit